MAMATRRLKPEDWAPLPQTRIQIRATPSCEPRDESPRTAKKSSRPAPVNYLPGEFPPIPNMDVVDADSPKAPEIVDFAAPGTWPRRALPPHVAYQQQHWGPKRVASPGSVSQYSSRQSEMSFGILDYYTRDPSPTRSPPLPCTPKLPQSSQGPPKIGTPVLNPAMDGFDFELPMKTSSRPTSQSFGKSTAPTQVSTPNDVAAGAERQARNRETPPPIPPPKADKIEASRTMYSLFPKDLSLPRPIPIASTRQSDPQTPGAPSSNISTAPSHARPDPSYRPRKESMTSSLRSRKDSFTGYRANAQRIPLRILSAASSNTASSIYTTPRTSNAVPGRSINTTSRTSSSPISPPDSTNSGSNPRSQQSRWSEDTISSPLAALSNRWDSFGSLLRKVDDERQSGQYPACFFEDDDDEVVPLSRKWGRSVSQQSQRQVGRQGEWEGRRTNTRRGGGWRRVLLCGCCG